ncbi:MAG: serine/threonine protein kinase [Planctomycetes bacterium]|nr:serine/threonine protein kinase [Planctomycetota bacterium]
MDERRPEPHGERQDLRDLVAQCLSRMDREGEGALDSLCAEHPGEAAELREALARLGGLGLVAEQAAPQEAVPEELGEFELVRKIGEGGMGVVYLARQKSLQREVALKLIRPDRLGLGISRERFVREIETIARLSHPGIVPIYAAGEDRDIPYYAMELLSGSTLEEVIERVGGKRERGLSGSDLYAAVRGGEAVREVTEVVAEGWFSASWTELALRIALQVAEALQHAHERGVLHRDVKPSNVMLTRDGRALLLDFGLATRDDAQKLTRSGAAVGSLPYMAPEQHRAEALDARTDVYALGLVLYELLTLRSPFLAASVEETRRRVLEGAAEPIRKGNAAVPWDVQTVCSKAMDREPERRYPSMAAFASDLRNLLELRPIAAAPPSRWLLAQRWAQRRPAAAAALALASLSLFAGIPLIVWNEWRHRREIEQERDVAVFERGRAEANAKRADEQRELAVASQVRAEAQAARAAAVLAFQRRMFRSVDPGENGREVKVAEVLQMAALEAESGYAGQPEVEAAVRLSLGETFAALSLLDQAEHQFRKALTLLDGVEGAEPRDRAALEFQLGRVRFSQYQLDEAERLLESARATYLATEGEGSRNAATVELELASIMRARSKVNEALACVAAVCERLDRTLGDGDRATLDAWGQYGQILALAGQQTRAEQVLRETIAKKQKLFSPESPDLLVTRINLANVLYQLEKHAEAHALAKDVREIQERVLGPDHAHTLVSLSTEATTLSELNDLAGAAKLERDLWERRARVLGPDHADTLRSGGNLASTLAGLGEDAESERITREILEKRLRVLGPEHWETGASHNHLASLLQKRNDFAAAHEHLVRAVVCARASFVGEHWIVGAFLNNLGRCETNLGRFDEAERTLLEAHAVLEKVLPAGHVRIHGAIRNLVALYEKSGNEAQRAAWAAKLPPK